MNDPVSTSLPHGEIHIWTADVDADAYAFASLVELLAADEIDRASRFHIGRDRRRFLARRTLLRTLAGHYTGRDPAGLQFVTNAYGKPTLNTASGGACLRFNMSHSGSVVALAFALEREVGIDVECVRPIPNWPAFAGRFLAATDIDSLRRLEGSAQCRALLSGWTECEAMAKAQGVGLPRYLEERSLRTDRSSWSLAAFDAGEDMVGSVASSGPGMRLLIRAVSFARR